jgi:hypothetical protein
VTLYVLKTAGFNDSATWTPGQDSADLSAELANR